MPNLKEELIGRLIRSGVLQACGKPLREASMEELRDEWGRHYLQDSARRKRYQIYRP